jgi:hypothetical protein
MHTVLVIMLIILPLQVSSASSDLSLQRTDPSHKLEVGMHCMLSLHFT